MWVWPWFVELGEGKEGGEVDSSVRWLFRFSSYVWLYLPSRLYGSGPEALAAEGRAQLGEMKRGGNECKAGRGGTGKGGKSATCLLDTHARSLLQTAIHNSFACQPESSLQKAACYFPLPAFTSLGFSPTASARVRAQWEKVAKAERKRLIPAPAVLAAACEMSLCALPPAQGGCLASVRGAGYRKL